MKITSQTTRQGKVIHLLSPCDLGDIVVSGERLRVYCPIHGGDHQRSLTIDPATGWGFCHCCHATVLVKATGSRLVGGRGNGYEQHDAGGNIGTLSSHTYPRSSPPVYPSLERHVRSATTLPHWQQNERRRRSACNGRSRRPLNRSRLCSPGPSRVTWQPTTGD